MHPLAKHPFFFSWKDPQSNIESHILTERVAPLQFPFYFTNSSISPDGEWLWFYSAFPPNPNLMLGRVCLNPSRRDMKFFPQAAFSGASPMVAPDSSGAYFAVGDSIWFISNEGIAKKIAEIPADYVDNRKIYRLATHLSLSCDGKYFLLDTEIGNVFAVFIAEKDTGKVTLLHEFDYCHNHGYFSPVNPTMFLLPRDWRRDHITGRYIFMESRLWVMDITQTCYRPLNPNFWEGKDGNTAHEWWTRSGKVCYIDYDRGVYQVHPDTLEREHIWKRPLCHAQCDSSERYFCADQTPYHWTDEHPLQVLFYDRKQNKDFPIVSAMPPRPVSRKNYHLDPHPHFAPDDSAIIYLTTVLGKVDVAVTPVSQCIMFKA